MKMSEAEKRWNYYQALVKESGFEGITELLAKHKDLQQKVIQLEADLLQTQASEARLRETLESLKEGTLLDAAGNRNDDGLADFWHFGRASTLQKQWVYKWLNIIDKALSTPPNTAELLAKRDDEVIEKCAEQARRYRANVSIIEAIRTLKGAK
jgi:hypothetical protein